MLLGALRAGDIDRLQAPALSSNGAAARRSAANAGSVKLYDTRCYFNVRSKADISQLNLPHGTDN